MNDSMQSLLAKRERFENLVDQFVASLPKKMLAFRRAYRQSDWDTLINLAHQLHGSASSYGFPVLGVLAAEIENGKIEKSAELELLLDELQQNLKKIYQSNKAKKRSNSSIF